MQELESSRPSNRPIGTGRLCVFHDFWAFFIRRSLQMRAEAVSTSRLTGWRPINEQRTLTKSRSLSRPIRTDAREDNDLSTAEGC